MFVWVCRRFACGISIYHSIWSVNQHILGIWLDMGNQTVEWDGIGWIGVLLTGVLFMANCLRHVWSPRWFKIRVTWDESSSLAGKASVEPPPPTGEKTDIQSDRTLSISPSHLGTVATPHFSFPFCTICSASSKHITEADVSRETMAHLFQTTLSNPSLRCFPTLGTWCAVGSLRGAGRSC